MSIEQGILNDNRSRREHQKDKSQIRRDCVDYFLQRYKILGMEPEKISDPELKSRVELAHLNARLLRRDPNYMPITTDDWRKLRGEIPHIKRAEQLRLLAERQLLNRGVRNGDA